MESLRAQHSKTQWNVGFGFLCPLDSDISRVFLLEQSPILWSCEKNCIFLYVIEKRPWNIRMVIKLVYFIHSITSNSLNCSLICIDFVELFCFHIREFCVDFLGLCSIIMCACVYVFEFFVLIYFYIIFFWCVAVIGILVCEQLSKIWPG